MNRPLIVIITLFFVFSLLHSQNQDGSASTYVDAYRNYDRMYHEAEMLSYSKNYTDAIEKKEVQLNENALKGFRSILPQIEKAGNDSLAFHCLLKIGTLEHYFENLTTAQKAYKSAIHKSYLVKNLPDSFLFEPFLFTGIIHYRLSQYDSALYYYHQAELINEKTARPHKESSRLYNTLGAVYYEMGNYRQATNYFEKALSELEPGQVYYQDFLSNYKINLASTLVKLEEYSKADSIYQDLLRADINRNETLHNLGTVKLKTGAVKQALEYFKQVRYANSNLVRLYNDIGFAYSNLGIKDSAKSYYEKAIEENKKWNGDQKNAAHGLTLKLQADDLAASKQYEKAAFTYQAAMFHFDHGFADSNYQSNPSTFKGVFSYINLFQTLVSKAELLEEWYYTEKKQELLIGALNAYQSAYQLADYVEKIYDSDEARLFLNKIKHTMHGHPIEISLKLYELTKNDTYLESAYLFDQQNKASVLSLSISENTLHKGKKDTDSVLLRQNNLRSEITRLSIRANQTTDSTSLEMIKATINDKEIELGKIQEKLNSDESPTGDQKFQRIPSVKSIQKQLDDQTSILSFHLSEKEVVVILISNDRFNYHRQPVNTKFLRDVDSLKAALYDPVNSYSGRDEATSLYQQLIFPIAKEINDKQRLIIIPDDELHYLPFEVLQNEQNKYLVERFSIQYQYSTALFSTTTTSLKNASSLAMAPFTGRQPVNSSFQTLPSSAEEMKSVRGKILLDSSATREQFLSQAPNYSILHLATHASANNAEPANSFIAFYPNNGREYKVYAQEIYDMDLGKTGLVILSACETGSGKLIKGEGLMSLSRAFAYAGCSNIISSIWKAEDKTVAYITQKLHHYLDEGYSKDRALRQAKLDLLKDISIEPRFKTPNYWANMIFIGQYEPMEKDRTWWWIAGSLFLFGLITWFLKRRRVS